MEILRNCSLQIHKKIAVISLGFVAICGNATHAFELPNSPQLNASAPIAIGDVVDQLGKNLMLVHQDSKRQWWFATWSDGLYRFDGRSIVHFTTKHGLPHNRTDQIVEDSAGNLYFNTMAGIGRFDGMTFTTLPISPLSEWKLMAGDLWFKSPKWDGKVFRFDGKILHRLQLPKNSAAEDFASRYPNVSPYGVYFVYQDKGGHVWFGTAATGVCRYDGKSFDWLTSEDVTEFHNGPSNGVRSIIQDHDSKYWFNTRYRYAVNGLNKGTSSPSQAEGIFNRLPGIGSLDSKPDGEYEYMSIAEDHDKIIWIATGTNGVFRYDGKDLTQYPVKDGSKVVRLFTIYCDREGTIWLGTHEDGAYRLNGTTFERFDPKTIKK